MSQKSLAALLLLVATALGGPAAVDHALDVQEQVLVSVSVEGPTECVVGELIELHVTGSRPSWLPPTADAKIIGDTLVVSFREDGTYEVIASAIAGQTTQVVKHVIVVGAPEPVEPTVPDNPVPTPDVDPKPESELTESVYKWCVAAKSDKAVCKQLSDNFIFAASNATTIDELLKLVAERNRKVNQRSVARPLAQIQQHLFDNLAGQDFAAHQCAFDEIGQGFLRYAGKSGGTGNPGFWK